MKKPLPHGGSLEAKLEIENNQMIAQKEIREENGSREILRYKNTN